MSFLIHPIPLVEISLLRANRQCLVDTVTAARAFTGGPTDHATDRGEGVRSPCNLISFKIIAGVESHHVATRVSVHRTPIATINLPNIVVQVRNDDVVNISVCGDNFVGSCLRRFRHWDLLAGKAVLYQIQFFYGRIREAGEN
jgi:hypothetical protein